MRREIVIAIATVTAMGCGLMSGIFFAFSDFVMKALSLQPPESAIRSMQAINIQIVNPVFLMLFVGTPLLMTVLAVVGALRFAQSGSKLLLLGSAIYLLGALAITVMVNIPLNNRLARLDAASLEASQFWLKYVSEWVAWNHVRAAAAALSVGALITAIGQLRGKGV
jgi:uncharacterized membrane protein